VTWPPDDISRVIADAFALRGRKGSDLLSRMGAFDLWRGNLAEMRDDSPISPAADTSDVGDTNRFLQTLAVSRALDYLQLRCEAVIRLVYLEGSDTWRVANELETTDRYAERLVENCTHRLVEVASKIYGEILQPSDGATGGAVRVASPAIPLSARADYDGVPTERK
jgi:hypothetical protein